MSQFRLADFLPYQLSVAANAVSRFVADGTGYVARFGLTGAEWRVLAVVTAAGRPTQAELIALTGMDKMTISRAVAPLCKRGLLDRVRDEGDRRTLRLSATPEGVAIHDAVATQAIDVEARLLAALSPAEAMTLRHALATLHRACQES
jgi:DNA-binding MarR family transcriptional regulator